jgi:hypothetical protein
LIAHGNPGLVITQKMEFRENVYAKADFLDLAETLRRRLAAIIAYQTCILLSLVPAACKLSGWRTNWET